MVVSVGKITNDGDDLAFLPFLDPKPQRLSFGRYFCNAGWWTLAVLEELSTLIAFWRTIKLGAFEQSHQFSGVWEMLIQRGDRPLRAAQSLVLRLLFHQPDVAVANRVAMVLQKNRTGTGTYVDWSGGRFAIRHFNIIVDLDSVVPNRHPGI